MVDNKTRRGNKMVKKQKERKSDAGSFKDISETDRTDLIECIGKVCFRKGDSGQPILSVKIDKDKNPKCAALAAKYVLEGREVNFDITSTIGLKMKKEASP